VSRINVVLYLAGIPAKNKNPEKPQILRNFAEGVRRLGDLALEHESLNYVPSDVGVIQGWTHEDGKTAPHLTLRQSVIQGQRSNNKKVLTADSNLFLYKDKSNVHHYLRYSYNGIFPNTGIYCDDAPDPNRWNKLSVKTGLTIKPIRNNGTHILLCLQRNGGWSMNGFDVQDWAINTINAIRQVSDRPIVIRSHPGDAKAQIYLDPLNPQYRLKHLKNITISKDGKDLMHDLNNAWAVVVHNSSPAVAAGIEGYPVFLTDPTRSQAAEIANTDLKLIETPNTEFNRQRWIERLSMFHWNFEELKSGECWAHMRNYI
jgi:hypothetical protein